MSQFNSLSDDFRKSMEEWGDSLLSKKAQGSQEDRRSTMLKLAKAFVDGPVLKWYEDLDEESQEEVNRVLSELRGLNDEQTLQLMRAEGSVTPMGFLNGLFLPSEEENGTEEGSPPSAGK